MKAVQINSYGGSEVLEINQNAPKSAPGKGQVLVEVRAASINPFDIKIVSGMYKANIPLTFPHIVCGDFAGVVMERGEGATSFSIGDEVYGTAQVLGGGSGAFAQFAAANSNNIAPKPKNTNFSEAAALPLVGASSVQALEEHVNLKEGQKVLIHGGAGGIGHIAVQLAKALGAYVATTVRASDGQFVKELGADEVIDYKTQKFEEVIKDFDAVFDTVGGEVVQRSFQVLKRGGVLVSMLGQPDDELAIKIGIAAIGQNTKTNTEHLRRLRELVENGKIKVHVDKVFLLDQAKNAWDYQKQSHKGKIVVEI